VLGHGPFTWGSDAGSAADNAIALEAVAAMAIQTYALNDMVGPIPAYLSERHYRRKHGPAAYYGQDRQ
jgi:L-ribulose-5-phosphate 4-epimerase